MSIIIADSGSTKTQWNIISNNNIKEKFTIGINPYFISQQQIVEIITTNFKIKTRREEVERIFFYGAGCSLKEKCDIVYYALKQVFVNADIVVASDLLASARALFGDNNGVACILGTGSNVAVYQNKEFLQNINSLGYILGDQSSGAYIGKELIRSYFQKEMPEELRKLFKQNYDIELDVVLENVYKNKFPNKYLANFAPFASENIDNSFMKKLITDGFNKFIALQLGSLDFDKKNYEIAFVGSIAYYFKDILMERLIANNYKVGKIIKAPMEGLLEYHLGV